MLPHASVIYGFAFRLAGNAADAEDLVQDTFYYGIKNFNQIRDPEKCKYWLFSILRNLFLRNIEKKKHRSEIAFDTVCDTLHQGKCTEAEYIRQEFRANLNTFLLKLDDKLRLPIQLFYFEEQSYKDIALQLDIPIGTVMSRIARAKIQLKKELQQSEKFCSEIESLSKQLLP